MAEGARERVASAIVETDLSVVGARTVPLDVIYMDDVVSTVCGMRPGNGVYFSRFGQRREWESPEMTVRQFVGAFGVMSGAEAVDQAREHLQCSEYSDRLGKHILVGSGRLPDFSGVDEGMIYCESLDGGADVCVVLLAREDVVIRLEISTEQSDTSRQTAEALAQQFATHLADAW
jgi:hypothetical protein